MIRSYKSSTPSNSYTLLSTPLDEREQGGCESHQDEHVGQKHQLSQSYRPVGRIGPSGPHPCPVGQLKFHKSRMTNSGYSILPLCNTATWSENSLPLVWYKWKSLITSPLKKRFKTWHLKLCSLHFVLHKIRPYTEQTSFRSSFICLRKMSRSWSLSSF